MGYGVVHFFPGGTKEQHEASLSAVHPSRSKSGPPQEQAFEIYNLQK